MSQERKRELIALLKSSVAEVTFLKVLKKNQTEREKRVMRCTLNEELLPDNDPAVNIIMDQRTDNENVIRVFDLDKSAWRSFRIDSILETKLL